MLDAMWNWLHKLASPPMFYRFAGPVANGFGWLSVALLLPGIYLSLAGSPPDYQQGESVRIMYVHVPAAWLSMFVYMSMAGAAVIGLVWRIKVSHAFVRASAPIGAAFTFLALVTGSLWGKPMWGTWWIWDARLTSELILLFLYLGFIALQSAIEDRDTADRAGAILVLVGVVNIPIIHYSVEWWNTLHQGATVSKFDKPSIDWRMLLPLLLMAVAFTVYYASAALRRTRCEILERERNSEWVRELKGGINAVQ
jgi:heme exporter protein C